MNRQTINAVRPGEVAARNVVAARAQAENRMTRLRPNRSASRPTNGAARATPTVEAVNVRLTLTLSAWKTEVNSGSKGCGT